MNIHIIFNALNWRNLIGLEALTIFMQNPQIMNQTYLLDSFKSLIFVIDVLSKNMNYFLMMDHKHAQMMINNLGEEMHNL